MNPWHQVIARSVARNPVSGTLTRIRPDGDLSVTLDMTPIQYQEKSQATGGSVEQTAVKWMIPAMSLEKTGFPLPPRAGDLLFFPSLREHCRIDLVVRGMAGGEIVRWDVSVTGDSV
jgi:hypothetical protein